MRTRWLAVVLLTVSPVRADPPVELPPLLTPSAPTPAAPVPKSPVPSYDHGYLYLPETAPPSPPPATLPVQTRPLGEWWLNASFDMGWATRDIPLPTLRLRVPGVRNGPILPLDGVSQDSFRLGFGASAGIWIDRDCWNGLDAGVRFLATGSQRAPGVAPGTLVFFPADSPAEPQWVSFPDAVASSFAGTFNTTHTSTFATVDVNYRRSLIRVEGLRLDSLVGYRYAYVGDGLSLENPVPAGQQYNYTTGQYDDTTDTVQMPGFAAVNSFHGGQVGFDAEVKFGYLSLGTTAKVAFGAVRSRLSETELFSAPEVFTGRGFVPRNTVPAAARFAVMPTLTTTLGWEFARTSRLFVGYSFAHLNGVTRLGDVLAPTGGDVRTTNFWAHAVNLGLEIRY
jgi:hypothetical protein